MNARQLLTRKRVLHWLQRQPADAMYTTGSCTRCPLASYLDDDYMVLETYVARRGDLRFHLDLPQWARRFITSVDQSVDQSGETSRCISRNEALKILRGVLDER